MLQVHDQEHHDQEIPDAEMRLGRQTVLFFLRVLGGEERAKLIYDVSSGAGCFFVICHCISPLWVVKMILKI